MFHQPSTLGRFGVSGLLLLTILVNGAAQDTPSRVAVSQQSKIRIILIDGKSGKPVRGRTVLVYASGRDDRKPVAKGRTDDEGVFSPLVQLPENIGVYVEGRLLCVGKNIGTAHTSLTTIVGSGFSGSNSYCNPRVQRSAKPGEMVLFVRRETLRERFDY